MDVETKDLLMTEQENSSSVEQARQKEMPVHSPRKKNARRQNFNRKGRKTK